MYGSVRGASGNRRPYRDQYFTLRPSLTPLGRPPSPSLPPGLPPAKVSYGRPRGGRSKGGFGFGTLAPAQTSCLRLRSLPKALRCIASFGGLIFSLGGIVSHDPAQYVNPDLPR